MREVNELMRHSESERLSKLNLSVYVKAGYLKTRGL